MNISYENFNVSEKDKQIVSRKDVLEKPILNYCCDLKGLYTIIMVDFDAPHGCEGYANANNGFNSKNQRNKKDCQLYIPSINPKNMTFTHWIQCNMTFSPKGILENFDEFLEYYPPSPPEGTHRYFFYIFYQLKKIKEVKLDIKNRTSFNLESFVKQNDLCLLDVIYYLVKSK